jgi:hypothetical protein
VPVNIGVKGSRLVEVSGDLSSGSVILSPGRADLTERTKVASSNQPEQIAVASARSGETSGNNASSEPAMHPAGAQGRVVQPTDESEDPSTSALRSAITAHIESVVLDARRHAQKY